MLCHPEYPWACGPPIGMKNRCHPERAQRVEGPLYCSFTFPWPVFRPIGKSKNPPRTKPSEERSSLRFVILSERSESKDPYIAHSLSSGLFFDAMTSRRAPSEAEETPILVNALVTLSSRPRTSVRTRFRFITPPQHLSTGAAVYRSIISPLSISAQTNSGSKY